MLQIEIKSFASDALEDAMRLAQTKALNSYSWSDMLNYLNYTWSDLYNRIAMIDSGYYSVTARLNTTMTKLPPFVKNTIRVYSAQEPIGFNREVFRSSGMSDMRSSGTYHVSGFDLYCPDATRKKVWLNYTPIAPMLFFPMHNRDPKLYEEEIVSVVEYDYNMYALTTEQSDSIITDAWLRPKNPYMEDFELYRYIALQDYDIIYLSCDFPYIFVTYRHKYTGKHLSGFFKDIMHHIEFNQYNPFDFTGRESNVEYLKCSYNDKTGMGVIVRDHSDYDEKERRYRIKELGWTPDTVLAYPCPEMYRYLVARLADKFAAFNESNVMGVSKELIEARYAFEAFCERDKSAWKRIDNVNGPTIGDWL
jgi:hypothetical protein